MAFQLNQFKLSNVAGETMNPGQNVISARISKDEASYYTAGAAVKFVAAEVGDAPVVVKMTTGDVGVGVVLFNAQKAKRYANEMIEIAMKGAIVTMIAGTAINRGVDVAFNSSTGKVSGTTGVKLGMALDIASADGDIIRVFVDPLGA